jgi:hypothetical protein
MVTTSWMRSATATGSEQEQCGLVVVSVLSGDGIRSRGTIPASQLVRAGPVGGKIRVRCGQVARQGSRRQRNRGSTAIAAEAGAKE